MEELIALAALPLLAMGCFGNVIRSVCNRCAKFVDRSVMASGAEFLSYVAPRAFDRYVESDTRRKRLSILESLGRALETYRHGYTLSLVARCLRGVESFSSARDACREAGYALAPRVKEVGELVTKCLLSLLDYDLLLLSLIPRLGLWNLEARIATSLRDEAAELEKRVSLASAGIAIAAEAWGRGSKAFEKALKLLGEDLGSVDEEIDSLLDTAALLLDPDNEVVAREVLRGGRS